MTTTPADLLQALNMVSETFAHLGERLAEAAEQVRTNGILPSERMVDELLASRKDFAELRDRAVELAGLLAASPPKAPEQISSMKDLEALVQLVAEAQEKRAADEKIRQRALVVLDRILCLAHRDTVDFPPLDECQAKARELREAITEVQGPDLHPEALALAQGRHPFSELLTLIEGHEDLDDDLWLLLKNAVTGTFGKPLALSAARGKLLITKPVRAGQEGTALPNDDAGLGLVEREPGGTADSVPATVGS
jgi:hypothetical protein